MNEEKEIWKNVEEYEGYYQISNLGRVRSLKRVIVTGQGITKPLKERLLINTTSGTGYYYVSLAKDGKKEKRFIHHLVLESFHRKKIKNEQGRHLDGNKLNNKSSNLKWGTQRDNEKDKINYDKGGHIFINKEVNIIRTIFKYYKPKISVLAKYFNCNIVAILRIKNNVSWKNLPYKEEIIPNNLLSIVKENNQPFYKRKITNYDINLACSLRNNYKVSTKFISEILNRTPGATTKILGIGRRVGYKEVNIPPTVINKIKPKHLNKLKKDKMDERTINLIKKLRLDNNLSIREISNMVGYCPKTIYNNL